MSKRLTSGVLGPIEPYISISPRGLGGRGFILDKSPGPTYHSYSRSHLRWVCTGPKFLSWDNSRKLEWPERTYLKGNMWPLHRRRVPAPSCHNTEGLDIIAGAFWLRSFELSYKNLRWRVLAYSSQECLVVFCRLSVVNTVGQQHRHPTSITRL